MIHQIDIKNEWLLLPASFKAKFVLVFVLTLESAFPKRFHFKETERAYVLLKNGTRDFQNTLRLRDRHVFMWQLVKFLNVFNGLTLKLILWKTKTFFQFFSWERWDLKRIISIQNCHIRSQERSFSSNHVIFLFTKNGVFPVTTLFFENFVSV